MELRSPEGAAALAAAARVVDGDPLAAAAALRSAGIPADLAAAALTQAALRRRAVAKFGPDDAARMFFTRAGLEQATRAVVAARRAARLAAADVRTVADLGCGLGADAIACARAGIRVDGVEADPETAAFAAANADACGVADLFTVTLGRAEDADVSAVDAVFCDPARRATGTGRRVFDPAAYSPPWDWVAATVSRVPRAVLKVAPGFDFARAPVGAEVEVVSADREVVEAALWCGSLARVPRRATVLRGVTGLRGATGLRDATGLRGVTGLRDATAVELTGSGTAAGPVGPVRRFLYDPDGAVVRAHLVAEFAATLGGTLADPDIAYVYADAAVATPYARCLEVVEVLPFSLKRLRALLRGRDVGAVEIMKRGSAVDVERLRRDLRLSGVSPASIVLTRVAGAPTALVCRPV